MEAGDSLAGASLTSKFQTTTIFPGVSSANLDVYVEYVPHPVPRGPRTVEKRGRVVDGSGELERERRVRVIEPTNL